MLPAALDYASLLCHICSYLPVHHALRCISSEFRTSIDLLPRERMCVDARIQATQSIECFEWFHAGAQREVNVRAMPLPRHIAKYAPVEVFDAAVRACARQAKPIVTPGNVAEAIGREGGVPRLYEVLQHSRCIQDHSLFCQSAAVGAASSGRLRLLKRFHVLRHENPEWFGNSLNPGVMDATAAHGHLDCLQWLHNAGYACTVRAMDDAAINGHMHIVAWLHSHRDEGCSTDAMDYAAMHGRLNVLQWLHERRFEGCTPAALNRAAGAGHFEVVRWLHTSRVEGCADMALARAAESGYLEIMEWLYPFMAHQERDSFAMLYAARNGHLHVVEWLYEHGWDGFVDVAVDVAVEYGHPHIVRWLEGRGSSSYSSSPDAAPFDDVDWARSSTVHVQ